MSLLRAIFNSREEPTSTSRSAEPEQKPVTLLVLQMDKYDWPAIFRDCRLRDGRRIRVVQTGWKEIQVHADTYSSSHLCVEVLELAPSASDGGISKSRCITVQPDFVLIRNEVKT